MLNLQVLAYRWPESAGWQLRPGPVGYCYSATALQVPWPFGEACATALNCLLLFLHVCVDWQGEKI